MTYRTTKHANEDIYSIYLFGVERFGVRQADRYNEELFGAFDLLSMAPLIARERAEYDPPIRIHFHRAHAIFYLLEDDEVVIVRVLRGSQDWHQHL